MTEQTDESEFRLVTCDRDGRVEDATLRVPADFALTVEATASLYHRIGFTPPWTSYAAVLDGQIVGGGAFVGAPQDGQVEIAYFTLPEFEGMGHAGRTAESLVVIAFDADPSLAVMAKTLPKESASTRILSRLGFQHSGIGYDEDAGDVWLWLLSFSSRLCGRI